jgi:hypothetical protein
VATRKVAVAGERTARVTLRLTVAALTETIAVAAAAPPIDAQMAQQARSGLPGGVRTRFNTEAYDSFDSDDRKDAGEIGAGHSVTALYEIVPSGVPVDGPSIDPLRYQQPLAPARGGDESELATVKVRYKEPDGESSQLVTRVVAFRGTDAEGYRAEFVRLVDVAAGLEPLANGSR